MKKFKRFVYINSYGIALALVIIAVTASTFCIAFKEPSEELEIVTDNYRVIETEPEEEWIPFIATAYCSCEICCEEWAHNRPTDENGNEIVYGASCQVLHQGISIAADWDVLPVNTEVEVEGLGYFVVQDKGGLIKGNRIDIYYEDHEEAREFGTQEVMLRIIEVGE